jgi:hypothetical protein
MTYYTDLLAKKGMPIPKMYQASLTKPKKRLESAFNEQGLRICSNCHIAKQPEEYSPNRQKIDGRDARCKVCKRELAKKYIRK